MNLKELLLGSWKYVYKMEWQNDIGRINGLSTVGFIILLLAISIENTFIKALKVYLHNTDYIILSDEWFKLFFCIVGYFILSMIIIGIIIGVQEKFKRIK